ncbi:Adaptor protein complex-1 sigma subunit transcript a, partial [Operophtera brumata]
MQFMLLFSRQGKLRLQKWYVAHPDKLKKKITRELITTVLARKPKMCSFLEWKDVKIAYFILDELVLGGELQETSKKNVLKAIAAQDLLQE